MWRGSCGAGSTWDIFPESTQDANNTNPWEGAALPHTIPNLCSMETAGQDPSWLRAVSAHSTPLPRSRLKSLCPCLGVLWSPPHLPGCTSASSPQLLLLFYLCPHPPFSPGAAPSLHESGTADGFCYLFLALPAELGSGTVSTLGQTQLLAASPRCALAEGGRAAGDVQGRSTHKLWENGALEEPGEAAMLQGRSLVHLQVTQVWGGQQERLQGEEPHSFSSFPMILCGQPLPSFSCKVFPAQELLLNPRQRPQAFLIMLCLGIARFASTQTFIFLRCPKGFP